MCWIKLAKVSQIPSKTGLSVQVKGLRLAVFKVRKTIHAIEEACPHRGAPLGDGPLRDSVVTCTWHGWEFDLVRGCHVLEPDIKLKKYETRVKKGILYVRFPSSYP